MSSLRVHVPHELGAGAVAGVQGLLDAARAEDRRAPLSEQKWLDLVHGVRSGTASVVAQQGDDLVGYAHLRQGSGSWGVETVVRPDWRDGPENVTRLLLRRAMNELAEKGGGRLYYWVTKPTAREDQTASDLGFALGRDLLQMRTGLPLPPEAPKTHLAASLRPFRVGQDESQWLEVNNRAFAGHPEQGNWDRLMLSEREDEPWFDPSGFLVYEERGRIVASCWTKVHADSDPPMGEIYVISVDPAAEGRGLGRALTVAGLDWLAKAGLGVGMLYVDESNVPAVALYRSLGFHVDHVVRAYVAQVPSEESGGLEKPG